MCGGNCFLGNATMTVRGFHSGTAETLFPVQLL
jgi:hypothetical protein